MCPATNFSLGSSVIFLSNSEGLCTLSGISPPDIFSYEPDLGTQPVSSTSGTILITEYDPGGPDVVEIQNVSSSSVDVTGWRVVVSSSYTDINLANIILSEHGQADLITSHNTCAHIDELDGVIEGVEGLLNDDGIFILECNYWGGMVKNTNYSLIYHDHYSYFS